MKNIVKMKAIALLLMMMAMMLSLTKCGKNADKIDTVGGDMMHISLHVGEGRHNVTPNTGEVSFEDGDVIYVGDGSTYIGTLTRVSETFGGDIIPPSDGTMIYFYFVGNIDPGSITAGTTTDFTVSIADQSGKMPVLALGSVMFDHEITQYSCELYNQCGLVKFVTSFATSTTVTVEGMNTIASVSFATPSITPTGETGGVTLYSEGNTARWAVLLPQAEVSNPSVTVSGYTAAITGIPEITANSFITADAAVDIALTAKSYTEATSADIGRVIAADGCVYNTMNDATNAGTAGSAMICYVGEPGTVDASSSEYRGLAISYMDLQNGTYQWLKGSHTICSTHNYDAKDGIANTVKLATGCNILHDHPAAFNSYHFYLSRPQGVSHWFLPSLGQWKLLLRSLTGADRNLSETSFPAYKAENVNSYLHAAGCVGVQETEYWTCTEHQATTTTPVMVVDFWHGSYFHKDREQKHRVRAVFAF